MEMPLHPSPWSESEEVDEEEEEEEEEEDIPHNFDKSKYLKVVELINEEPASFALAIRVVREALCNTVPLNLNNDSVLHEVIFNGKTRLAIAIIGVPDAINSGMLLHRNYYGNTPMHVAAEKGDITVAKALLEKDKSLAHERNSKGETPLHKAVKSGHLHVFDIIIKAGDPEMAYDRTDDGSTILHCAIMHDRIKEALTIAKSFPDLILTRDYRGASPLQIMAAFFKDLPPKTGILNDLLYKYITSEEDDTSLEEGKTDIEGLQPAKRGNWWSSLAVIIYLRRKIAKSREEVSKQQSKMDLVGELVRHEGFEFYLHGFTRPSSVNHSARDRRRRVRPPFLAGVADPRCLKIMGEIIKSPDNFDPRLAGTVYFGDPSKEDTMIWEESPLITGVKLGLDEFVIQMLKICPKSATYVGYDGMNVLQAAVKYGRILVVQTIKEEEEWMPPWLFTDLEFDTKNTIFHLAASSKNITKEADPLCLQDELVWFEMMRKIVPEGLRNYRNRAGKTAREVFEENHEKTLKGCRDKLAEIGRTCSPLLAAVVFTSSFNIPGENNRGNRVAYKIFSHVYVVGFSCAATSLVMFLLLAVTPFRQQDFRRMVPSHYLIALFLLAVSLSTFIIAFACNMYLQIYSQQRNSTDHLLVLLFELLVVPYVCAVALFLPGGASWKLGSVLRRLIK